MIKYSGTGVNKLVTVGPIRVLDDRNKAPMMQVIEDTDAEIAKFDASLKTADEQLGVLYDKVLEEKGEETADIINVQQMMLEDDDYLDAVREMINDDKVCAEYAVYTTGQNFSEIFASMDNAYMNARATDVIDISRRLVGILTGASDDGLDFGDEKLVLVADDLGPSETVKLDRNQVLAFVTVRGSANSHTAILARTMGIPALAMVNVDLASLKNGTMSVVDGEKGEFILEPDEATLNAAMEKVTLQEEEARRLATLKGVATETKSGKKIKLYANIGGPEDIDSVLEYDAEGIGLFRSEFLYLGKDKAPTEDEQYKAYRTVLEKMGDKPVIIRTLDIGADKQADYLGLPKEENPALGLRAIRICLTDKEIFKVQLRALLRAACFGNLHIMYPMIISESEIDEIKELVAEVAKELETEGIEYKIPSQGIMIETPAAVMISESLAKKVDFFSIGSNDLTQYTLAIDRQNEGLAKFYDPYHPALIAMIKMVIDNAHKAGIWAGVCGELGADEKMTKTFIDLGLDELSVTPRSVLKVRDVVRALD